MRIATYNVHGWVGRDGRRDPERVVEVIAELSASVVGLQEVEVAAGHGLPPAMEELEGLRVVALALHERPGGHFGNLLLSRWPAALIVRHDVSRPGREPRTVLEAALEPQGHAMRVLVAHFGLRVWERRAQAELLVRACAAHAEAVAVLGDVNEWLPLRRTLAPLDARFGRTPAVRSFPAWRPLLALDRVWLHPAACVRSVVAHRSAASRLASDHLPVVAEITWPPPA